MDTSTDTSNTPPPPPPPPAQTPTPQPLKDDEQPAADEEQQFHHHEKPLTQAHNTSPILPSRTDAEPAASPTVKSYTKRLLPESLSSLYPHGLITGEARTAEQQAALDARKSEILSTMTDEQIEEKYQSTVKEVQNILQEIKDGNERIDKEVDNAQKTRAMERKAWLGMCKAGEEGDT